MSLFRAYEDEYDSGEFAIFQQASEDACRKVGLDPAPSDDIAFAEARGIYHRFRELVAEAPVNGWE